MRWESRWRMGRMGKRSAKFEVSSVKCQVLAWQSGRRASKSSYGRAKQTQFAPWREQWQVLYVETVTTNLTRASRRENKANCCYGADREIGVPGGDGAKRNQFGRGPESEMRKTNPISGGVSSGKSQVSSKADAAEVRRGRPTYEDAHQTKPIYSESKHRISALGESTYDKSGPHEASAKQSQIGAGWEVLWAARQEGAKGAKRTQFPLPGRSGGRRSWGPIVQNEPNSRRRRYPSIPLFHHSSPVPIVQNEANSHHQADREIGAPGRRLCKTNPNGSSRWSVVSNRPEKQTCKNEPDLPKQHGQLRGPNLIEGSDPKGIPDWQAGDRNLRWWHVQ